MPHPVSPWIMVTGFRVSKGKGEGVVEGFPVADGDWGKGEDEGPNHTLIPPPLTHLGVY